MFNIFRIFFYTTCFMLLQLAMIMSQNMCERVHKPVLLFLTPGVIRDFTSWLKLPD